jgi:hypothetical protein
VKSTISAGHTAPAHSKDSIAFARAGFFILTPRRKARCRFVWQTIDGMGNGLVELKARPELVQAVAFSLRPTVQVELFDLTFRVRKSGYNKATKTLLLLASSFFSGIASALTRRGYRGVDLLSHRKTEARLVMTRRNSSEAQKQ